MYQKYAANLTTMRALIGPAFDYVKNNLGPIIYLYFVPSMLVNIAYPEALTPKLELRQDTSGLWLWLLLVGFVWSVMAVVAFYTYQVRTLNGEEMTVGESYAESAQYIGRVIGASILIAVMVGIGLLLLIVPGLIVLRRYVLTPYYIVDRDLGVFDAMSASAQESKPLSKYVWSMLGLSLTILIAAAIVSDFFGKTPPVSHLGSVLTLSVSVIVNYMIVMRYFQIKRAYAELKKSKAAGTKSADNAAPKKAKTVAKPRKTPSSKTTKPAGKTKKNS